MIRSDCEVPDQCSKFHRSVITLLLRQAVHDTRLNLASFTEIVLNQTRDLWHCLSLLESNFISQIRPEKFSFVGDQLYVQALLPIEAREEPLWTWHSQLMKDVTSYSWSCSGGESNEGNTREVLPERREFLVVWSEVMPPLRHAVSLVNDKHAELVSVVDWSEGGDEVARVGQLLRSHVEQCGSNAWLSH